MTKVKKIEDIHKQTSINIQTKQFFRKSFEIFSQSTLEYIR